MFVVKFRKIWFALSVLLIVGSLYSIFTYGFKQSVDFSGGTLTELHYTTRPEQGEVEDKVAALDLGNFSVRTAGETNYVIRTRELTPEEGNKLVTTLGAPQVERQSTVGPVAGAELKNKAVKAVILVVIMIVLFVTFAFRKVSRPVSSWKYGFATIVALLHDVLIPTGVFVFLGHAFGYEIDLLFVSGLLAVLGYSVHDTIVVFDRVRENLRKEHGNEPFEETVGKSVSQTFGRSINTSLTIFIVLLCLYFVGPLATEHFALLLIIGIVVGTYSSIFIASPLLVTFYKFGKR